MLCCAPLSFALLRLAIVAANNTTISNAINAITGLCFALLRYAGLSYAVLCSATVGITAANNTQPSNAINVNFDLCFAMLCFAALRYASLGLAWLRWANSCRY